MIQSSCWPHAAGAQVDSTRHPWLDGWSRLVHTLSAPLDADALFESVCRDVVTGFGFARSVIATVDEKNRRLVARAGYDPNLRTQAYMALVRLFQIPLKARPDGRFLLAAWCVERQEQAYVPDASVDSFRPNEVTQRPFIIKALGTSEYVVTPIVYRGRAIAVLGVDKKGKSERITVDEQALLREIAELLALRFAPLLEAESDLSARGRTAIAPRSGTALGAFRSLLDAFDEALLLIGRDQRVRYANRAAAALLGLAVEEIGGRSLKDVLRLSHPEPFLHLVESAQAKSHSLKKRERLLSASGAELDVQIRVLPLAPELEADAILIVPGGDRTENRRFRDELFQSVLHDLLAPIQSMVGFAELLQVGRLGQLTAEQAEFVSRIVGGGEELISFIDRLLTVKALESRENPPRAEDVSAGAVISRVFERVDGKALRARVRLSHDVNGQLPPLRGDFARFSAVFQNLVDNAIDSTAAGGTVRITGAVHDEPGYARFSVTQEISADAGATDAPSFDDDWTGRGAGRKRRSHGLGLAIVRRIVEGYGGELWAEGELESELAITFTLPLAIEQAGAPIAEVAQR